MGIYLGREMKMYDLVVLGSGIFAESFLKNRPNQDEKILATCNNVTNVVRMIELDEKSVISSGTGLGLSSKWHSVIPFKYVSGKVNSLLTQMYPNFRFNFHLTSDFHRFFVPYMPWRPKFSRITKRKNVSLINELAYSLDINKSGEIVIQFESQIILAKRIVLAIGPIAMHSLIRRSSDAVKKIISLNSSMDDHISSYLGNSSKKFDIKKSFHGAGFSYRAIVNKDFVHFQRPAYFDFRNVTSVLKFDRGWAETPANIIFNIFRRFSIGLVFEALFNKLGIQLLPTKTYNFYTQFCVNGLYKFEEGAWRVNFVAISRAQSALDKEVRRLKLDHNAPKFNFSAGIHYANSCAMLVKDDRFLVLDASLNRLNSPLHHTFLLANRAASQSFKQ